MFECDKCGLCCTHLSGSSIYAKLDRGDGTCKYFDGRLCSIYDKRPLLCRIDDSFDKFFSGKMTREEFYELNYKGCMELKIIFGRKE